MRIVCHILLLSAAPLMVMAQNSQEHKPKSFLDRLDEQTQINPKTGMMGTSTSSFANKNFNVSAFDTKILNGKSSSLTRSNNNFSFPNTSFARQFQTGTFSGFGGSYATAGNKTFATDRAFDLNKQPFSNKVLDNKADRDSGKSFTAQNWNKKYADADKMYQGKEMTELGSFSGSVNVQNKDDMKWGQQDALSSEQIREILNKNK